MHLAHAVQREQFPRTTSRVTCVLRGPFGASLCAGTLPSEVGMMTALETFDVSANVLTGGLPSELGRLSLVTSFKVYAPTIYTHPENSPMCPGLCSSWCCLRFRVLTGGSIQCAEPFQVKLRRAWTASITSATRAEPTMMGSVIPACHSRLRSRRRSPAPSPPMLRPPCQPLCV